MVTKCTEDKVLVSGVHRAHMVFGAGGFEWITSASRLTSASISQASDIL